MREPSEQHPPRLSIRQERLWFLDQLEPGSPVFHLSEALGLCGPLDPAVLERNLHELVRRHEVLRTTVSARDGLPLPAIVPELTVGLAVQDLAALGPAVRRAEARRLAAVHARRPFDLERGPLLRAALLRLGEAEHVLLLSFHLLVADAGSLEIANREILDLYRALTAGSDVRSGLPELEIQVADVARRQRRWLETEEGARQLAYWKRQLEGVPAVLDLPVDHPRRSVPSYRGARRSLALSPQRSAAVRELSRRLGVSRFELLLAAFQVFLLRYTGQEDLVVGSPVAGRGGDGSEGLIGPFVNRLVLRGDLRGDPDFLELLERVATTVRAADENRELPFERLVEELQPERESLCQVRFVFRESPQPLPELPDLRIERLEVDSEAAELDWTLEAVESVEDLTLTLEYRAELFDATTIRRALGQLRTLLAGIAADPGRRLGELPLLGAAERQQLLVEWRGPAARVIPEAPTLSGFFEARVERTPEAVAVSGVGGSVSFGRLNARANQLAHHLRALGVGRDAGRPETVVGIVAERVPEVVVGLLGILKAGGVYLPLDPSHPAERLAFQLRDAGARVVLARESVAGRLPSLAEHGARLVYLDGARAAVLDRESTANPERVLDPDRLAYVIYTSGTTGTPKGVAVSHRQLLPVHAWFLRYFGLDGRTRVLQNLSPCFDFGVFELLTTLLAGGTLTFVPAAEQGSLSSYLDAVARHDLNTVHTTPSFFRELTAQGPLPGLEIVHLGGEAISRALVRRIEAVVGTDCRVYNGYGPTEASINSTVFRLRGRPLDRGVRGTVIPIGRATANSHVYVLDRRGRPQPVGVPGELAIGGEGVARGYLNRPGLTAERFVPDPRGGGERVYRSGDLVRWLPAGDLEFLGRIDHQVKIRGLRIELGEIEAALARHPEVGRAVVLARDRAEAGGARGERWLVAYVVRREGSAEVDAGALRRWLGERLPSYMVPSAVVFLDGLPRTATGKVDRRALPAPERSRLVPREEFVAPRNPAEEVMVGIWSRILRTTGPSTRRIGVHDNFFALGGHSLVATRLISRIRDLFGVELELRNIFEAPTPAALVEWSDRARRAGPAFAAPPIEPLSGDREGVALSFAQQRLWFLAQLDPASAVYNIPLALRLRGPLHPAALERSLDEIVRRHAALRTRFGTRAEEPCQLISPPAFHPLPVVDLTALAAAEDELRRLASEEARRPFDLALGPLLRTGLLRVGEAEHVLLVTMHHVASDGWSVELLYRELAPAYQAYSAGRAPVLPELGIQYADFACWQREWLQGEVLESQLAFWREQLAGIPGALDFPTDRPRPAVESYRGATRAVVLPQASGDALWALSREQGCTLYMTLLAAFQVLLHRHTGQDDVVVGSLIANRNRSQIEGLIGFFVNTLVLRGDLAGDPGFPELLAGVRELALQAYAHQDLPFEKLVEELEPERDLSRHPLFQIAFHLLNMIPPALEGLEVSPLEVSTGTAKFDLELAIRETGDELVAVAEYSTDLFDATTILRLLESYRTLLAALAADPQRRLSELPLLAPAAAQQLHVEWNDTGRPDPGGVTIPALFEAPAVASPDATAVVAGDQRLSYRGLNRRANRLARHLRTLGVGPEILVGICLERSAEMVVAILGVLKAGGAYLPLDPEYPRERLAFMLDDAKALLVLTEERLLGVLPDAGARVLCLDRGVDREAIAEYRGDDLVDVAGAENLAYLIYTSGSTGRAKAVAIEHRSAVAMVEWSREVFAPEEVAAVLASTSICFDLSVFELFVPLSRGGTVILAATALDLPALPAASEVTLINTVPSAMAELLRAGGVGPGVRTINLAGEPLRRALVDEIAGLGTAGRVLNLYGPSEDTTYSTSTVVAQGMSAEPTIGRPVAGTRSYLVDRDLRPVPAGVVGELLLAGEGLARGYLDRPEQTASRFPPDPWSAWPGTLHLSPSGGTRMYRTGDLARFAPDGELEFLGRIDHQVKVRGFRIELGEIEATLGRHPGVREVVVVAREDEPGDPRLVAYLVPGGDGAPAAAQLRAFLGKTLPDYMVPVFVALEALPLTANGKVDRRALPAPEGPAPTATPEALCTPVEEAVAGIWSEVLGVGRIGGDDDFFALGGHSLLAIRVLSRIAAALGVELPRRALFTRPTVAGLAGEIEQRRRAEQGLTSPPLAPVPRDGDLPLTFAEQRMWFLDHFEPGRALYNISTAVRLRGRLDIAALERTLNEIVRRHESLRTVFPSVDGRPRRVIGPPRTMALPIADLGRLPESERETAARRLVATQVDRPFDLAAGPLLRAGLVRLRRDDGGEEEHLLWFSVHHIVADGWSQEILIREVGILYNAFAGGGRSSLAELPIQLTDYACWQRRWLEGEVLATQLGYWRRHLGENPPPLVVPGDRPRPPAVSSHGALISFELPAALSTSLEALHGTTPFFTLLAAFQALLGCYAGRDRVIVGTPVTGRSRTELEGLIGLFVNTLALSTDLSGDPPFQELVARARRVTLEAFDHQDTPFDKVVEALQKARDPRYHPLVQVLFSYLHAPLEELELEGVQLAVEALEITTARFDLTLAMARSAGTLVGSLEYNTDLFDASTIHRIIGHYRSLLENVAADPAGRISELAALQEVARDPRVVAARSAPASAAGAAASRPARRDRMAARRRSVATMRDGLSDAQKSLLAKWTRKRVAEPAAAPA
ncbi:MAG: amino acid adenylation domain-containing protein, partial [bacterium]|nr:amino acid adenylation domain-containing protein [bacterium]